MPELPEVEVVRAGLAPAVTGARVEGVEVLDSRSIARHPGDAAAFEAALVGRALGAPARRGKFLWVPLLGAPGDSPADGPDGGRDPETTDALLAHLGMSGQLLVREVGAPADRHTRIRLLLDQPSLHAAGRGALEVRFADQRIFGGLAVRPLVDGVPDQAGHIALDPVDPAFDASAIARRLRRRRQGVKAALLDQTLVSGIGNIYADEALWRSRLHYATPGERLTQARALALLADVRDVLEQALAEGGTSFDAQYVNVNGQAGYFEHRLNAYGRGGLPCPRCGATMVREPWANRSSTRCPRCQRRPRGVGA
ncbi:bifunctional DNA-formamidopyrimidine glycosylase/DNA-(apurinic or apyrimidinic site) lyase [Agrococcus sp. SCSIO52902]|uniref:bifunctional DNA-formamidopyrimidine glycosylase/DNA-(apurinic or apyrimidinic site) lyase n=1 Tax=Agrococcus sp. SCSIO52902 TaxID=2933290 RepID=UPI001FF298DC|nr:bifunctional DNA-formamidopyrimidine glycosylase/DNA-(apurinic or apyrimidinic site) lyase [Agrococcus sp. SCSIO52902]UOW00770.1 bifunctional DNA-formamidopyrimidine glycosylase/DNA-(apurinic or apyrimidinic site) lyase [Agrococcus sp. SCSIO52902]